MCMKIHQSVLNCMIYMLKPSPNLVYRESEELSVKNLCFVGQFVEKNTFLKFFKPDFRNFQDTSYILWQSI